MYRHPITDIDITNVRIYAYRAIVEVWRDDAKQNPTGLRSRLIDDIDETRRYMDDELNYELPFKNLAIQFVEGDARWNDRARQWKKTNENESLTICLPNADGIPIEDQSILLEKYSQRFPTIFGNHLSQTNNKLLEPESVMPSHPGTGTTVANFLPFGSTIGKLIAESWADDAFRKKIDFEHQHLIDTSTFDYYENINTILKSFGPSYENPWEMGLKFIFSEKPDTSNSLPPINGVSRVPFFDKNGKWKNSDAIRTVISIEIPTRPNQGNLLLAQTDYKCAGPKYPFTCS